MVEGGATAHQEDTRAGWSDSAARAVLQLMVESVAEMVGFEVAALSVVLDGNLATMAYTGPEEFRDYLSASDPVTVLDPVLARAESWGRFRFLAAEDYDAATLEGHWMVVAEEQADVPDAWHPMDVLVGLLTDDDGRLVGAMSVDRPVSGRRPDPAQRRLLERYAAQAERAVVTAFEREELVQQVAHSEAARRLIRSASMPAQASLQAVLDHTHGPLVEGFGAAGSWIQVLDPESGGVGYARTHEGDVVTLSDRMIDLAHGLAPRLWEAQQVLVVAEGVEPSLSAKSGAGPLLEEARRQIAELGLASAMAVPLGAGAECLGFLVLSRRAQDPPWSSVEIGSALQIGYDLGAALMTVLALERERGLVRELQQLDDYRSQLIATLSHELRTPLTVISGNLELLGDLDLDEAARHYQVAMTRGSTRMQKVVDDLLLLARVSDPQHPLVRVPVDLHAVSRTTVDLLASSALAKGLDLRLQCAPDPLLVPGDPAELDRLLTNLVSNAVKYTPSGGTVTVAVERRGDDAVLAVADDGMGISEEDQVGLFRPFFRTTNPDALREPGTGLGLTIVATIVDRHAGEVRVRSRPGEGTTFTVTLPAG
ncbi:GAF domain-containing sensor histidine kinase [Nocardioides sp.]|uniref:sensor histidine kinase n=1 Tax=Nocardioides sp. TaxID=35761 RepID=UPI0026155171|nr:GAF domain-containing sensor histidine kinase [Nocardioides sp.]MDI6911548.1 GAF domain-containing sensor histidine kinase [Nocardioides sp.]